MPAMEHDKNRRARILLLAGSALVLAALVLREFAHPQSQDAKNVVHFVGGLFLGLALAMMVLGFVYLQRGRRRAG